MNTESQNKYRIALIEKYEQRGWECLALYNYYGGEYSKIEKEIKRLENMIEVAETDIRNINNLPDHHTVENKEKVKALKVDCQEYEKRIEGVTSTVKIFFEKAAAYREEAVRALEIVENFKAFSVKTPEEIEAAKNAPVESVKE